jgi:hypothetical protein
LVRTPELLDAPGPAAAQSAPAIPATRYSPTTAAATASAAAAEAAGHAAGTHTESVADTESATAAQAGAEASRHQTGAAPRCETGARPGESIM